MAPDWIDEAVQVQLGDVNLTPEAKSALDEVFDRGRRAAETADPDSMRQLEADLNDLLGRLRSAVTRRQLAVAGQDAEEDEEEQFVIDDRGVELALWSPLQGFCPKWPWCPGKSRG